MPALGIEVADERLEPIARAEATTRNLSHAAHHPNPMRGVVSLRECDERFDGSPSVAELSRGF